jgi:AraC-like DNA-binding protein
MNTLHSSLYAIAITCCLFYSFVATSGARQPSRRFVYLGIYLALESLGFLFEWLMLHPTAPGKSLWLGSLMALSFLLAPCLWLYAREIAAPERPTIRSLPPWHFAVAAAGMLLTLPLIHTAHLGPDYANPDDVAGKARSLFVHGTMLASAVLFLIQVPWYLRASVRILAGQVGRSSRLFSALPPGTFNILRILILVLLTHWFVSLLRILHCVALGQDAGLGIVFASLQVAVTVWAFFSLLRPPGALSSQSPQLVGGLAMNEQDARPTGAEPKYARSSLNLPARTRIQRKLHEAMRDRRLHCDSRLSLRGLCHEIRENPHYVSQVLNQDLATSFHDLVNRHRIEDAKRALVMSPGKTVLEICLETGFSSKSTFNTAFRRHTGMTPSEYRSRHLGKP